MRRSWTASPGTGATAVLIDENAYDCSGWPEKQYEAERCATHPVAQKKPNGFGLADMIGNVWEWTNDAFAEYPEKGDPGRASWSGPPRLAVLRGCSWSSDAERCRAAYRDRVAPDFRDGLHRLSSCEVAPSTLEHSTLETGDGSH